MKVYVLVIDSSMDYEPSTQVRVFQTLSQAQEAMWGDVQCAELDDLTCEYEDNTNILYQEAGDYTRNHIEWTIYEREVEPDKELQQ